MLFTYARNLFFFSRFLGRNSVSNNERIRSHNDYLNLFQMDSIEFIDPQLLLELT